MLRHDLPTFGSHMAAAEGYIAEPGVDRFRHRFGGQGWRVRDPDSAVGGPALLVTLSLGDPRLSRLAPAGAGAEEIPLISHINSSFWWGRQVFRLRHGVREAILVEREVRSPELLPSELMFPDPLPERG